MKLLKLLKLKDNFELQGEVKWVKYHAGTNEVISESPWMKNKIMANDNRGIYIFLDRLIGINTYSGNITHADLGIGTTDPTINDTSLEEAIVRSSVGFVSASSNTRSLRFFYADALTPNNTYTEFGTYIDGDSSIDTGQLFNHLILSVPLVKATGEDNAILIRITGNVV